jgi:hypothetical protein
MSFSKQPHSAFPEQDALSEERARVSEDKRTQGNRALGFAQKSPMQLMALVKALRANTDPLGADPMVPDRHSLGASSDELDHATPEHVEHDGAQLMSRVKHPLKHVHGIDGKGR